MVETNQITCPYCDRPALLVTGKTIYPHRVDLWPKYFYACSPCDAYVGCHPDTLQPLGRLANAELRAAKMRAHAAFDGLWRDGGMKRSAAYDWLVRQLDIKRRDCHIGAFDVETCQGVVKACSRRESGT
jgi:hypothetical protein